MGSSEAAEGRVWESWSKVSSSELLDSMSDSHKAQGNDAGRAILKYAKEH